ncbi:MAG: FadR family transcriptional regulator [Oscillospiraceae bacterium]|mgnify:CR=1 FL=1|nr:FadR family transcriptional regulator [Oscillospiraceae bacterium]
MAFREIVAPTLRELFVSQIIEMIFSGELHIGDKLPSERELSEQMHISRSMVHTGLEDLERMGFVRIEPRRGNYIADYSRNGNFETLSAIARYGGGKFDRNLEISMVEMRNAVEGGAMIRLADRRCAADIQTLRALTEELRAAAAEGESVEQLSERMRRFDTAITELSGNCLFPLMMNAFGNVSTLLWERCVQFWGVETVIEQERHITDLLEAGKGHEAALYIENIFRHYLEAHKLEP